MSKSGKTKSDQPTTPATEPVSTTDTAAPIVPETKAPAAKKRKPAVAAPTVTTANPNPVTNVIVAPQDPDKLASQYDLPDSGYDDELDAPPRQTVAPAATAAPAEPESETETPAPPAHNPTTVAMAANLGLADDEIASMSPAELDRAVMLIAKRDRQQRRPEAQPAPPAPTAAAADEIETWKQKQLDKGIDEETVEVMARLLQKQQENEAKLQRFEQSERTREQQAAADKLDRMLEAHNSEWFGKGSYFSLNPASPEAIRRANVNSTIQRLVQVDQQQGRPLRSYEEYVKVALTATVPAKTAAAAAPAPAKPATNGHAKPRISEEVWNQAGSARPTNRTADEPKGDHRAMRTVKALIDQTPGLVDETVDEFGSDDKNLYDGLLD